MKKFLTLFFVVYCLQISIASDGNGWSLVFYFFDSWWFYIIYIISSFFLYKDISKINLIKSLIPLILVILNIIYLMYSNGDEYDEDMFIASMPYLLFMIPFYIIVTFKSLARWYWNKKVNEGNYLEKTPIQN